MLQRLGPSAASRGLHAAIAASVDDLVQEGHHGRILSAGHQSPRLRSHCSGGATPNSRQSQKGVMLATLGTTRRIRQDTWEHLPPRQRSQLTRPHLPHVAHGRRTHLGATASAPAVDWLSLSVTVSTRTKLGRAESSALDHELTGTDKSNGCSPIIVSPSPGPAFEREASGAKQAHLHLRVRGL